MKRRIPFLFLAALGTAGACRPASGDARLAELASRERRIASSLTSAAVDSASTQALARWILPRDLGEISGVAVTSGGSLLAHGDERGQVFLIDPRRGVVLKRFTIGTSREEAKDDFEGMAIARGRIFMVSSAGRLYEFLEGAAGERVRFSVHDTQLEDKCEFEGLAWDPVIDVFLFACKQVLAPDLRHHLVVHRWSLSDRTSPALPPIIVRESDAIGTNPWKSLHPSDITVDPVTGNYVIIAAQERALIVINPLGGVVRSTTIPLVHTQAEAVALTADGILIVGDEATNRPASLTLYRWPLTAATPPGPP
jgi:uncharacterized protein YjiK